MGMAEWGYSVLEGSPSEQFTTSGAEASVKYIGPSLYRVPFIKEVFGAWHVSSAEVTIPIAETESVVRTLQCVSMSPEATAYPYMTVLDEEAQCTGEVCLWPDTFSGQPSGDSKPYLLDCGAGSDLGFPILDQCAWEYTVNYRYKNNGSLPEILKKSGNLDPTIPFGTYTECRITANNEFMTTPGRFWEFNPRGGATENWGDHNCADKKQLNKVVDEDFGTQLITNISIEVIWSNVPLPPWEIIRRATGCVNSHPIFGYPAGAVLFESAEPEITGYFGCMEVYRIRYIFKVKTTPISTERDWGYDVINGQLGIWNRRWSPCYTTLGKTNDQGGIVDFICTHWTPVTSKFKIPDPGEQAASCDAIDTLLMFKRFPLQMLFAMNVCTCPLGEAACQEPFGQCGIDDPVVGELANASEGAWYFLGMTQQTYDTLPLGLSKYPFLPYEPAE